MTPEHMDRIHVMAIDILTETDLPSRVSAVCKKLHETDSLDSVLDAMIVALLAPITTGINAEHPDAKQIAAAIRERIVAFYDIMVEAKGVH